MIDIEKRLTLRAAESPRSEEAGLMLEGASCIATLRKALVDFVSDRTDYAHRAGFYEGVLTAIRSGILPAAEMIKAADDAVKRYCDEP